MGDNLCLCGYHVHTGTLFFGIYALIHGASNIYNKNGYISSIFLSPNNTELLSSDFVEHYPSYKDYFVAENFIWSTVLIIVSVLLIVANRLKWPLAYWPFIIYMFFGYIISVLRIIFVITIFVWSSIKRSRSNKTKEENESDRYQTLVLLILGLLIAGFVQFYAAWVAERGRRWLYNEEDVKMDEVQVEENAH